VFSVELRAATNMWVAATTIRAAVPALCALPYATELVALLHHGPKRVVSWLPGDSDRIAQSGSKYLMRAVRQVDFLNSGRGLP
jgi:hypothetical protein